MSEKSEPCWRGVYAWCDKIQRDAPKEMSETKIEEIAYAMQLSYRLCRTRYEAVLAVAAKHPDADHSMLHAMWRAIDAYVDMEPAP